LADIDDEEALIEHLKSQQNLLGASEATEQTNDTALSVDNSNLPQNDLLSKFLNSLPTDLPTNDELYYEQMNDERIKEAQEKIQLDSKMHLLKLSNEQYENDENVEVVSICKQIETDQLTPLADQFDRRSMNSHAISTASTFSPHEVKSRLMREKKKRDVREKTKVNPKNIKGDANALRRKKKNDQALANEDLKGYMNDSFW